MTSSWDNKFSHFEGPGAIPLEHVLVLIIHIILVT